MANILFFSAVFAPLALVGALASIKPSRGRATIGQHGRALSEWVGLMLVVFCLLAVLALVAVGGF